MNRGCRGQGGGSGLEQVKGRGKACSTLYLVWCVAMAPLCGALRRTAVVSQNRPCKHQTSQTDLFNLAHPHTPAL